MIELLADLTVPAAVSLGVSAVALIRLAMAFVDADLAYFDPRPRLRTAGDRLLVEVVRARHTVRELPIAVAALLILTIPTGNRS